MEFPAKSWEYPAPSAFVDINRVQPHFVAASLGREAVSDGMSRVQESFVAFKGRLQWSKVLPSFPVLFLFPCYE